MSECDLCGEQDEVLYPIKPKISVNRHICRTCIETVQEIKLPIED